MNTNRYDTEEEQDAWNREMLHRLQPVDADEESTVVCNKRKLLNLLSYARKRKEQEQKKRDHLIEARDSLSNALQREVRLKLELAEAKEEKTELLIAINKLETRLANLESSSSKQKKKNR